MKPTEYLVRLILILILILLCLEIFNLVGIDLQAAEQAVSTKQTSGESLVEQQFRLALSVSILLISLIGGFLALRRMKEYRMDGGTHLSRIGRLQIEKKDIEYMIELAKARYHKHQIDEESFREIVRDHQKRLIEIDAEIKKLGTSVTKT